MKRLMLAVSVIVFATGLGRAADYYVAEGGTGDYSQGNPGPCPAYCSRNCALSKGDVIHVGKGTYTLTATTKSILLNAGVSLPELENETDILGNPRVKYGVLDIGACECIWRRFGMVLLYK